MGNEMSQAGVIIMESLEILGGGANCFKRNGFC